MSVDGAPDTASRQLQAPAPTRSSTRRGALPVLQGTTPTTPTTPAARAMADLRRAQALVQRGGPGDRDAAVTLLRPWCGAPWEPFRLTATTVVANLLIEADGDDGDDGDDDNNDDVGRPTGCAEAWVLLEPLPLEQAPAPHVVSMLRAQALQKLGRADDAVAHADDAVARTGGALGPSIVLAEVHKHRGALQEAVAALLAVRAEDRQSLTVVGHLAAYGLLAGDPRAPRWIEALAAHGANDGANDGASPSPLWHLLMGLVAAARYAGSGDVDDAHAARQQVQTAEALSPTLAALFVRESPELTAALRDWPGRC